jgi:ankyrin repeat protein
LAGGALAYINSADCKGITALHAAAACTLSQGERFSCPESDRHATVRLLLQHGASANLRDATGCLPLHYAAKVGACQAVSALLDASGSSASSSAAANAGAANAPGKDGKTALHEATKEGRIDAVRLLLQLGASTSVTDDTGRLPLHYAAAAVTAWGQSSEYGTPGELLGVLLDASGADALIQVNTAANDGLTPLHMAAAHGFAASTRLLLHRGADCSLEDDKQGSAASRCQLQQLKRPPAGGLASRVCEGSSQSRGGPLGSQQRWADPSRTSSSSSFQQGHRRDCHNG